MLLLFLLADYVVEAKEILFHITPSKIQKTMASFEAVVPAPMTSQFADQISKGKAIERKASRLSMANTLIPSGKVNSQLNIILSIMLTHYYILNATVFICCM